MWSAPFVLSPDSNKSCNRLIATQPSDYVLSVIIGGAVILSPLVLMKMREHPSFGGVSASGGAGAAPKRGRRK